MSQRKNVFGGVFIASLAAGPIFLVSGAVALLIVQLPNPIVIDASLALLLVGMIIPSSAVGAFIALPFNAFGAALMAVIGEYWEETHTPGVWIAVGALVMLICAALIGLEGFPIELAIAMAVTGGSCAAICYLYSEAPEAD